MRYSKIHWLSCSNRSGHCPEFNHGFLVSPWARSKIAINNDANMGKRSQIAGLDDGEPDRRSSPSIKATSSVQPDQAHQHLVEKEYGNNPQSKSNPQLSPEAAGEASARLDDHEEDHPPSALDGDRTSSSSVTDSQDPVFFGSSSPLNATSSSTTLDPSQRSVTPNTPITTYNPRSASLPAQPCLLQSPNGTAHVYIPLEMLRRIDGRRGEDENVNHGTFRRM